MERLGVAALTDAELVALVLRSGGPGLSALGLSETVLADGGLRAAAAEGFESLARRPLMGAAKAAALVAAFELGRRAVAESAGLFTRVRDAGDVAAVARRELTDVTREMVLVLVLSATSRLVKTRLLTIGTETQCLVDPRDVLHLVVASGGSAFAIAHNHPSGELRPSAEDRRVTELLQAGAASLGLHFLDHVIVSSRGWRSIKSE